MRVSMPKAIRTHSLRYLGPKTLLCRGFGLSLSLGVFKQNIFPRLLGADSLAALCG